MTMEYIRRYYGVPAKRGGRVRFKGRPGRIVSADEQYLNIQFDDRDDVLGPYHPTWEMVYEDSKGSAIK